MRYEGRHLVDDRRSAARTFLPGTAGLNAARRLVLCGVLAALVSAAGCGRKVGDDCRTSADCDPGGTRTCDISQPGGYCIVEGCDARSCPEDSFCMRFFPEMFLSQRCGPAAGGAECRPDELCLDSGVCARRDLERRVCVQSCGDNDDCRDAYECRASGQGGALPLTLNPDARPRFCAPR